VRKLELRFLLFVLLVPVITFPGSITFSNWDAPYGFGKDLSVWLSSIVGGWLFLLAYGAWNCRKGRIRASYIGFLAIITVVTSVAGYWVELSLHGECGFGSGNIVRYAVSGIPGFILSLTLFPVSLLYLITGNIYSYDRPLVVAWLVLVAISVALTAVLFKKSWNRET